MTAGVNHNPVEKTREACTVRFVYENEAKESTAICVERFNTIAGFNPARTRQPGEYTRR
ncbi:MAG: hypothetical protein PHF57_00960 [Methanoregula sp.]|jgi:hypothetical protein|nr:hypothetical protein [Methanoregula sp.]MDD5186760.1 hypothetical protein [Methanoregula sp.]